LHANIAPVSGGQAAPPTLDKLAAIICAAHTSVVGSFSNAIEHAIDAGRALIAAKAQTPHGRWGKFLKRCNLGERQAERYMCLARLAEANPTWKSDLISLSIESAIKKLAPPKHAVDGKERPAIQTGDARERAKPKEAHRTTHLDIIAAWDAASREERTKALDAIGLAALFAAVPENWRRQQPSWPPVVVNSPPDLPADLSIPDYLRRAPALNSGGEL
jgi:hypothetical protein